ncbi:MAG: hypothetical protein N2053_07805 [Chitinispirillaceae bacterium]|nr:hypothetical protein [Chitinispirillaceae bacterium]
MKLDSKITLLPYLHSKAIFSLELRKLSLKEKFDCIAVDLPEIFSPYLSEAIDALPIINAIVAKDENQNLFYLPIDPCDTTIEAIRQSFQQHIPFFCVGYPSCRVRDSLPPLPDEYAIVKMGFDEYIYLCLRVIEQRRNAVDEEEGRYIAYHLRKLTEKYNSILAVIHLRHVPYTVKYFNSNEWKDYKKPLSELYSFITLPINPDHLYFALGELPFVTAKYERERYNPFAEEFDPVRCIKELFCETRDDYSERKEEALIAISPVRIQAALQFLRNLTVMNGMLMPSLFDIVDTAEGGGGSSFGLNILKSAKYYPWLPLVDKQDMLGVGIDRVKIPVWGITDNAINLFRDYKFYWRKITLKPEPSEELTKKYRFFWNPLGMCSHIPEDIFVEKFNDVIRRKARKILVEDHIKTEKFTVSIKDGIDIRETLRHWFTEDIYVKEIPPSRGKVDTVVIIFDPNHDELYPHRTTWYAEHPEESTLTFFATSPYDNIIGPGIARCTYGGLSLLYPPRHIPDIFQMDVNYNLKSCTEILTYGAILFTREKYVAFVSKDKPSAFLKNLAAFHKKRLLWIPLSNFSLETIQRLRRFHILNGKIVRSWASRFIGE